MKTYLCTNSGAKIRKKVGLAVRHIIYIIKKVCQRVPFSVEMLKYVVSLRFGMYVGCRKK